MLAEDEVEEGRSRSATEGRTPRRRHRQRGDTTTVAAVEGAPRRKEGSKVEGEGEEEDEVEEKVEK